MKLTNVGRLRQARPRQGGPGPASGRRGAARRRTASTCSTRSAATTPTRRRPTSPRTCTSNDYDLTVVGLPKTIDNDIVPIKQSLGAWTAAEQASVFAQNVIGEHRSGPRMLIVHEVMGRACGWLTAASAMKYREWLDTQRVPARDRPHEGPLGHSRACTFPRRRSTLTPRPSASRRSWTRRATSTSSCPRARACPRSSRRSKRRAARWRATPSVTCASTPSTLVTGSPSSSPSAWAPRRSWSRSRATSRVPPRPTREDLRLIKSMTDLRRRVRPARRGRRHRPRRGGRRPPQGDRVPAHRGPQGLRHDHRRGTPSSWQISGSHERPTDEALAAAGVDGYLACEARQQPHWPDADALARVDAIASSRCRRSSLRARPTCCASHLAAAGRGEAFVLQGGDCAEIFAEATADRIRNKIKTILQMAVILTYGASTPVVKIGRMAGQYAKPRSSDTGDARRRDPARLPRRHHQLLGVHRRRRGSRTRSACVDAYHVSASTLNLIRAFTHGGFADLRRVHAVEQGLRGQPRVRRVRADGGARSTAPCASWARRAATLTRSRPWSCSRATRRCCSTTSARSRASTRASDLPYDCSAHFLWIGERTRQLDGAHVEFMSKIHNPIGVKLGPTSTAAEAIALARAAQPRQHSWPPHVRGAHGCRQGARRACRSSSRRCATRACSSRGSRDPMHGNTFTSESGYKTRRFDTILDEVTGFFEVHRGARHRARRHPRGTHGRRRHRDDGRHRGDRRRRASRCATRPRWTRGSITSSRWSSRSSCPSCSRKASSARRTDLVVRPARVVRALFHLLVGRE